MTSGLEDIVITVFEEWLSDQSTESSRKGLILLHNYPHIAKTQDIRQAVCDGWKDYLCKSYELLSGGAYQTARKQVGFSVVCAAAAGAYTSGLVGAGIGCIVGVLVPYAIAFVRSYMVYSRTKWLSIALQIQNPDDWEGAIKYALSVHKDKLDTLGKQR